MGVKRNIKIGIVLLIIGGIIVFVIIKRKEEHIQVTQNPIFFSEFIMENGKYVGEGFLSEYTVKNHKSNKITNIPFDTMDIDKKRLNIVGKVDRRENGCYGIIEYNLERQLETKVLVYDKYKEFVQDMKSYGGQDNGEGIKSVKFLDTENGYSFLYGDKLWKIQNDKIECLMSMESERYEWLNADEILIGKNNKIISYHMLTGKEKVLVDNYHFNGTFALSDDKKFIIYEGEKKHGLYKYVFETNKSEYLTDLSGESPRIAIAQNCEYVAYYDSYFTISNSTKGNLHIYDLENQKNKIVKKWHKDTVGGIVW